jgi:hypothetical protein
MASVGGGAEFSIDKISREEMIDLVVKQKEKIKSEFRSESALRVAAGSLRLWKAMESRCVSLD